MAEQSKIILDVLSSVYIVNNCYYWIDYAIVYAWIIHGKKKYDRYVQERLNKIKNIIKTESIKLIPSRLNPADIGTRGMTPRELAGNVFWFFGPDFLLSHESSWPNLNIGDNFGDYDFNFEKSISACDHVLGVSSGARSEADFKFEHEYSDIALSSVAERISLVDDNRSTCLISTPTKYLHKVATLPRIIDIDKFSCLRKLLRITAFVIKFKN